MLFDLSNPMNSLVVFAAILGVITSVCRALLERRGRTRRPGLVAPYLLLLATGLFGTTGGVTAAFKAVAMAGPDVKVTTLQVGVSQALEPLILALLLTGFLGLVDGIGALLGAGRPQTVKTSSRASLAVVGVTGLLCLTGSIRLLAAAQAFVLSSSSGEAGRAAVSSLNEGVGAAGILSMAAVALGLVLVVVGLIRGVRDLARSADGRVDAAVTAA